MGDYPALDFCQPTVKVDPAGWRFMLPDFIANAGDLGTSEKNCGPGRRENRMVRHKGLQHLGKNGGRA